MPHQTRQQPHLASNTSAPGQATASFGGDTEVAYAISADGPTDLHLSEQQLNVAVKKNVHIYYQVWQRPHPDAAS